MASPVDYNVELRNSTAITIGANGFAQGESLATGTRAGRGLRRNSLRAE